MKKENLELNSMEYLRYLYSRKLIDLSIEDSITVSLDRALKKSLMINLHQVEGNGKTTGLASYILGHPHCSYMKIGPSYTMGDIFSEMLFLMTGKPVTSFASIHQLVRSIAAFLTKTKDKRLVCIDDCTFLTFRQLSHFQELRDLTIKNTSFVFIAPASFKTRLLKAREHGIPGVGEFYRRFQGWIPLTGLTKGDIEKYCKKRELTTAEVETVKADKFSTIAELEILLDKIIEDREYHSK